ncbi:MAG TPA: oligopeptide/dipeptide ABC transporter ATP-binding protein [Candidatus Limnocylindrales bacterium]|nr:oligopeptide/dipeptide ABC transporter ATP-binding protein [Candidatus Limnocylindrales bacterium]
MTTPEHLAPTAGPASPGPTVTEHGTVNPSIRGRLRTRLPGHVRTARGQLSVLAFFAFLTPFFLAFLGATGGLAKLKLPTNDIAIAIVGNLALAGLAVLASRLIVARSQWGYLLALVVGAVATAAAAFNISRLVAGGTGLAGNGAFFYLSYQAIYVLFGLAIFLNLLLERRWANTLAREAGKTTGTGLAVPLRDIRIRPGGVPESSAPGSVAAEAAALRRQDQEPLLAVRGLKKHFPIHGGLLRRQIGTVYAVDGIDFDVFPGEIFSLVGESGCGKTTLGRTVLQLTPPTAGKVVFDGYELADVDPDDMRPLRRRMQIIFQDPFGSLNPRMPVSDIIGEGLLAQGIKDRKTRDKRTEDSLEIVGLRRDYTRRYPHEFSGGQRQRIGIARALALGPDLVVCDEPVSALDVSIQSQVLNLLLDLRRDFNLTYLFISHNLSVVQYFSDRVGVMYLGKLVEEGAVEQLYRDPRHPYTVALLSAIPNPDPRRRRKRLVLKGDVPSPAAPPSGCRFHTRCWLREKLGNPEICSTEEPMLRPIEPGHRTACHFAEEVSETAVEQVVETQSVVETAVADPV